MLYQISIIIYALVYIITHLTLGDGLYGHLQREWARGKIDKKYVNTAEIAWKVAVLAKAHFFSPDWYRHAPKRDDGAAVYDFLSLKCSLCRSLLCCKLLSFSLRKLEPV